MKIYVCREVHPPRLNALRRNTIQGSIFSNTVESLSITEPNDQLYANSNSNHPINDPLGVSSIKAEYNDSIGGNDSVDMYIGEYSIKQNETKYSQIESGQRDLNNVGSSLSSSPKKQEGDAVSNAILQNTFYQNNVSIPPRRTESLKEPISDGIVDNVLDRRRWVSVSRNSPPITRGRQTRMPNAEGGGSTNNISTKRYNNAKRKCSFSSFNECRYWEDDGKTTTTYLFSSDTVPMRTLRNETCLPDRTDPSDKNEIPRPTFKIHDDDGVVITPQQNNLSFRKAMKRQVTNIGHSNSFNVSADIRRKLFVNRYREWSLQNKKPVSDFGKSQVSTNPRDSTTSNGIKFYLSPPVPRRSTESTSLNLSTNNSDTETYDDSTTDPIDTDNPKETTTTIKLHPNNSELETWDDSNIPKAYTLNASYTSEPSLNDSGYMHFPNSVQTTNHEPLVTNLLPESPCNVNSGSLISMTSQVHYLKIVIYYILYHA